MRRSSSMSFSTTALSVFGFSTVVDAMSAQSILRIGDNSGGNVERVRMIREQVRFRPEQLIEGVCDRGNLHINGTAHRCCRLRGFPVVQLPCFLDVVTHLHLQVRS